MIHQYHERFGKMAGRFIRNWPALQGDESSRDLLINEIYCRVLVLPEAKRTEKIIMQAAWYACMDSAIWHMSCITGRGLNTQGKRSGGSKRPCAMTGYEDEMKDAAYYLELDKRVEFGWFFKKLNQRSRAVLSKLLMGNNAPEIAKLMGLKQQSISDILQRIKKQALTYAKEL